MKKSLSKNMFIEYLKLYKDSKESIKFVEKSLSQINDELGSMSIENILKCFNEVPDKLHIFKILTKKISSDANKKAIIECFPDDDSKLQCFKYMIEIRIEFKEDEILAIAGLFESDSMRTIIYDLIYGIGYNNDGDDCCICMDNEKNIMLDPCGHICVCEKCSNKLETCPICRSKISAKKKVYK